MALIRPLEAGDLPVATSIVRDDAYRQMAARGFRTAFQGVSMHRNNESGYSRPGLHILDDWR